jgi:hypothetical protein
MTQLLRSVAHVGPTGGEHFWPGTPTFNQDARDDAWARILSMLAG